MGCGSSVAKPTATSTSTPPFRAPSRKESISLQLPKSSNYVAFDFTELFHEKVSTHFDGTREWAFSLLTRWLSKQDAPRICWISGGGGTGKSVIAAEFLRRFFSSAVAWHFCRHDDPSKQSSVPRILRSIACMLCIRLKGFEAALKDATQSGLSGDDAAESFELLLAALTKVSVPPMPVFILLDALDEMPAPQQVELLDLLATSARGLPAWMRILATSREDEAIRAALNGAGALQRLELHADDANNRIDVDAYLRWIASRHVKGEVLMRDIERAVAARFKVNMQGQMLKLQPPMNASKEIYSQARAEIGATAGFEELVNVSECRDPTLTQASDDFDTIYVKQAPEAQAKLLGAVASKWVADPANPKIEHPAPGKAAAWVQFADSPGIKGELRSREKMVQDYHGHANKLKDLARLTLRYNNCEGMVSAINEGFAKQGIRILTVKNRCARCCLLLPAAACCCLLLPAAACCCLLLPAVACCCLLLPALACSCSCRTALIAHVGVWLEAHARRRFTDPNGLL